MSSAQQLALARALDPRRRQAKATPEEIVSQITALKTRALNAAMSSHILHSAHMRMAEYFLARFPRADQQELLIPATPKHYGELNNMVRQTAHRVINDFEASGLLTRREEGRSYLLNRAALEEYLQWEKSPVANTAHEFAHFLIGRKKK
ncbi:helix-turn-helix domain-containing protein [Bradyrhizobium sp. 215_C5_N1_2]|uniref:helix-turn-helix domain-containing protein n=1 Tax=Bradyrhizobium sp. 215_C5_N1_2 TaxID=3240381 RepID=UPI003F8B3D43